MKNWDEYWLNICKAVGANSKCWSRQIGAVIVKDNKLLVATGYNGPVSGAPHCDSLIYRKWLYELANKEGIEVVEDESKCPRRNMGFGAKISAGLEFCQAAHAERNAIDIAARLGHPIEGCTMYMSCPIPCLECAKSIVNAGIKEIVLTSLDVYEKKGISGLDILKHGGVKIREFGEK
jgi:dCMP deaminase